MESLLLGRASQDGRLIQHGPGALHGGGPQTPSQLHLPTVARVVSLWSHRRGLRGVHLLHELGALHPGLPPLRPALGLVDLYHKEGQDHHGSQEGEDRNGLTHFLVIAARHDPSGDVPGTTFSGGQGSHLRAIRSEVG